MAIETSARLCQIAVHSNAQTVSFREETGSHSNLILTLIQQALDEADLTADQLDYVVVTRGPGSFTGLRVGIAVAQGLAFAHDIPVIPLSSLHLTAWEWARQSVSAGKNYAILATLDARMSQLYAGWFTYSGACDECRLILQGDEQVVSPQSLTQLDIKSSLDSLGDATFAIVGSGLIYQSDINSSLLSQCELFPETTASADGMIDWVLQQLRIPGGISAVKPHELAPIYIRDNVVG